MVVKYQDGVIGEVPPAEHDSNRYHEALANCRFDKALDEVWEQVRDLTNTSKKKSLGKLPKRTTKNT